MLVNIQIQEWEGVHDTLWTWVSDMRVESLDDVTLKDTAPTFSSALDAAVKAVREYAHVCVKDGQ